MNIIRNKIIEALNKLEIEANEFQIRQWLDYLKLLEKWNKVYNLTAINNFDEMLIKHLFDSLSIFKYIKGSSTVDVGTGGGLPGVILAILYPKHQFTLVDSVGKKISFIKNVKNKLGLNNINPLNIRIENLDDNFHNIISRAFSSINKFYELCNHLLNQNNQMILMKGPNLEKSSLDILSLDIKKNVIKVPFLNANRNILIIKRK